MNKKGQITMESLLLYGLAILVVLLAIGALTFFGVLDLGRALPDRCSLTGSGALECLEWSVSKNEGAASTITLGFRNSGTSEVTITQGVVDIQGATGVTCTFEPTADSTAGRIVAGEEKAVEFTCRDGEEPYTFAQNVGQKVRGSIELTYSGQIVTTNKASGSLVATLTS